MDLTDYLVGGGDEYEDAKSYLTTFRSLLVDLSKPDRLRLAKATARVEGISTEIDVETADQWVSHLVSALGRSNRIIKDANKVRAMGIFDGSSLVEVEAQGE